MSAESIQSAWALSTGLITHAMPPLAMVKPFCSDGSPDGSSLRLSLRAERISCGLPGEDQHVLWKVRNLRTAHGYEGLGQSIPQDNDSDLTQGVLIKPLDDICPDIL